MDVTWFAPLVVLSAGAVGASVLARRIGEAAQGLATSQRRFHRLEQALIPVRVETRRTRGSVDHISHR
jgi:hypothetical protein